MEECYLEFLKELAYCLENYEKYSSQWADWMNKSTELFKQSKDLNYFFRAFGGMSSFNDEYFYYSSITKILDNITYNIASSLKDNKDENIYSILEKEKKRYITFCQSQGLTNYDSEELNYLNYLINNYQLSNLHEITEKYREEKNKNETKKC